MLVVITGGPYSGKTTLVEAFGRLGYATGPEVAIQVISELNAELGVAGQIRWREENRAEFQRRIVERQVELERRVVTAPHRVTFFDRGRLDGLGYCRHYGIEPPPELVRAAREARYDRIGEAYREHGCDPVFVPDIGLEKRVRLVSAELALPARR